MCGVRHIKLNMEEITILEDEPKLDDEATDEGYLVEDEIELPLPVEDETEEPPQEIENNTTNGVEK